ncbi:MAG: hypothetical protein UEX98_02545, partial [Ellagibacter isourolithinifaciens]|nr:hypothetical protein [Ellagibacter isourolithinifaciens]
AMTRTVPVRCLISLMTFALGLSIALPSHAVTVAEAVAAARNTQLPDIDGIMANHDGVLDAVGGGSTEVVMGMGGVEPVCAHSFNVGCRRVTEKFLASDPPAPEELARARAWIHEKMASWFAEQSKEAADLERVVAVAGTATTVVSIRDRMEAYDSSRVHKARVSRQDLLEVYERLAALPLSERKQVVGLDPKRAPVMVAGLLILLEVLDFAGVDAFTVSETDILHGITLAVSHEVCEKSCL